MSRELCPFCHHSSLNEIPPPVQHHQASLEINELYAQINEIDESVAALSRKRFALLQSLNEVQPTTSVLPKEILPLIFQLACPPPALDSGKDDPSSRRRKQKSPPGIFKTLQSVSTCWRGSFMSAPELWTNVSLRIHKLSTIESEASTLRRFLQNSGDLPLTLSFHYEPNLIQDLGTLIHPSVDALLCENLRRVENLHLTCPPPAWFSESLPYPKRMVEWSLREPNNDLLMNFHPEDRFSVSRLTIINSEVVKLPSPSCITALSMIHVPLDLFYACLRQCPNVAELRMRYPPDFLVTRATPPMANFTLEHLEILDWTVSEVPSLRSRNWEIALLDNIRFPALKRLCWFHSPQTSNSTPLVNAITEFFERLPMTMTEIELCNSSAIYPCTANPLLLQAFRHIPENACIERIILTDCSYIVVSCILLDLRPTYPDTSLKFPRLQEMTIGGISWESGRHFRGLMQIKRDAELTLPCFVADLLERRLEILPTKRFALHLECGKDFWWLDSAKQKLKELQRRYERLQLSLDSKYVHWL